MSIYSKLEGFFKRLFDSKVATMRTNTVCQVVSYDANTNLVNLQPCIMGVRTDDTDSPNKQLPPINDIPVFQFGSSKLWATVAPTAGAYGLYVVSDRNVANWILQGGIVPPVGREWFDLSNGFFLPGLLPTIVDGDNGKLPAAVSTDRISFRTRTGNTEISVKDDETININNASGTITMTFAGQVDINGNFTVDP